MDQDHSDAWSNLGVLYLMEGNLKLSNQAFGRAQAANPENASAWTGQAWYKTLSFIFIYLIFTLNRPYHVKFIRFCM